METLSLAANIIPIIESAAKAVKVLEKIARLRYAPLQLLQLLNEVSDFRIVIATVQETIGQLQEQNLNPTLTQHLHDHIEVARQILGEIDGISKDSLTIQLEKQSSVQSLFITWNFWIRKYSNLKDLSTRMQQTRIKISTALTVITASEIPRLRITLQDITLHYHRIGSDVESLSTNISTLRPSIGALQGILQNINSTLSSNPTRPLPSSKITPADGPPASGSMFRIFTKVERDCNSLCICNCHRTTESHLSSPQWLKSLIGLLFLTYNASPLFGTQSCSETMCRRNTGNAKNSTLLKANYYFPTWLLSRMISLRDQWTPLDGHRISIRTPRVVQDPIYFVPIMNNHLLQLQIMFARHEASPFDVDMSGTSALIEAVNYQRADICQFLIHECADPHLEDQFSQSSIDYVFHFALITPDNPDVQAIYRMFLPFIDADDLLARKGFSSIHQIVLGFRPGLALGDFLALSTVDIDKKDGRGWSPLFWAVRTSNLAAVDTLLRYRASMELLDPKGYNILHVVMRASKNRIAMLQLLIGSCGCPPESQPFPYGKEKGDGEKSISNPLLGRLLNHRAYDNMTPISLSAYKNYYPETHLLLKNQASPDLGRPLVFSIQSNSHSVIRLLLSHHAATDIRDSENMTILHLAACFGDLQTLQILRDFTRTSLGLEDQLQGLGIGASGWGLTGEELDKWGRSAAESFENVRREYIPENGVERDNCEKVFKELLTILKPPLKLASKT